MFVEGKISHAEQELLIQKDMKEDAERERLGLEPIWRPSRTAEEEKERHRAEVEKACLYSVSDRWPVCLSRVYIFRRESTFGYMVFSNAVSLIVLRTRRHAWVMRAYPSNASIPWLLWFAWLNIAWPA